MRLLTCSEEGEDGNRDGSDTITDTIIEKLLLKKGDHER